MVDTQASNIIAYSGGVDSSLTAALVHRVFEDQSTFSSGHVEAVLGVSAAVPVHQIDIAKRVASFIGIPFRMIETTEGKDPIYIKNEGMACYACKTHLYTALNAVAKSAMHQSSQTKKVILYNGTNSNDTLDTTRVGLQAATEFSVQSPLIHITKDQVRTVSQHLGLPNWNYAASPCLRSRLALGMEATVFHLEWVEKAESWLREVLGLDYTVDLRVRCMEGRRVLIELDRGVLMERVGSGDDDDDEDLGLAVDALRLDLERNGFESMMMKEVGFESFGVREFRSGSVAKRLVPKSQ